MSTTLLAESNHRHQGTSASYPLVPASTAPTRAFVPVRDRLKQRQTTAGRVVPVLVRCDERAARLYLAAVGFLPVSLIAASMFDIIGLKALALAFLVPAVVGVSVLVGRSPASARLVLRGMAIGIVATALYDVVRFGFLFTGLMHSDPIPHIGAALGLEPTWVFGYLWRYLGNGGGLAIAFFALGLKGARQGAIYGLLVCSGLVATLVVAPNGQQFLFPLNPTTIVMATIGHVVFGVVLGGIGDRMSPTGAEIPQVMLTPTPLIDAGRR